MLPVAAARGRLRALLLCACLLLTAACRPTGDERAAGGNGTATAPLHVPASISGAVELQGRSDHGGVQVYIPGTSTVSITNAAGDYRLSGVEPGDYEVHARAEGFASRLIATIQIPAAAEPMSYTVATARLEPAQAPAATGQPADGTLGALRGRLTLAGTDPEVGAGLDWTGSVIELRGTPYRTTSAADGTFLFWNIPADTYTVDVRSPGFEPLAQESRVLPGEPTQTLYFALDLEPSVAAIALSTATEPTTTVTTADLAIPALATLSGYAIRNTDQTQDMSGITIALGGTSVIAVTDAEGFYTLENIPPGSYQLIAQTAGYRSATLGPFQLEAGEDLEADPVFLEPDVDAPYVIATAPADGSRGLSLLKEMPIDIQFSTRMNPASVGQAIRIEPPVAFEVVAGGAMPQRDYNSVRVVVYGALREPAARFKTRYTLTVDASASDEKGTPMEEPYQMSFTTGSPSIVDTYPRDGGQDVPLTAQNRLMVYFNATMDGASLSADSLRISPRLPSQPNVSIVADPQTGWSRLDVLANWEPNTLYRVTIQRRARTLDKQPLDNAPYTFRFRTSALRVPNNRQDLRNQPGQ